MLKAIAEVVRAVGGGAATVVPLPQAPAADTDAVGPPLPITRASGRSGATYPGPAQGRSRRVQTVHREFQPNVPVCHGSRRLRPLGPRQGEARSQTPGSGARNHARGSEPLGSDDIRR